MLRLESVSKTYERLRTKIIALQPATFAIQAGEFVAVVGPSGSGKTTLLSIVGGMLAPSTGKVWIDAQSLYDLSVTARTALRRQKIGFVFQTFNLVSYLTALENVEVPLYLAGRSPSGQRRQALALLERVGLADRAGHKPTELSVGQQQRVSLARTLANDPALILADEPTGNLDPETREHVLDLLCEFNREGRTIVMVTHDPVAAAQAGRTLYLAAGNVAVQPLKGKAAQVA
jgi:putative ABC transport system ATP-binding protein